MFKLNSIEKKNFYISCGVIVCLVFFDHLLKFLAFHYLRGTMPHSFFLNTVVIEYAENRGAFLGLGSDFSELARTWIFVIGVFFILGFCCYSWWRSLANFWVAFAFSLVIAGGIGNLIDRIVQGYVVDYIHMGIGPVRTGVFNLADMAISFGLLYLVFAQYKVNSAPTK